MIMFLQASSSQQFSVALGDRTAGRLGVPGTPLCGGQTEPWPTKEASERPSQRRGRGRWPSRNVSGLPGSTSR